MGINGPLERLSSLRGGLFWRYRSGHAVVLRRVPVIAGTRGPVHPKRINQKDQQTAVRTKIQTSTNNRRKPQCRAPYWLSLRRKNSQNVVYGYTYHYYVLKDKTLTPFWAD